MNEVKTVFVGLSGGVDSSVAALRLIKQGYNVVGVFIKVWHPEFMVCNWEAERLDAMRVAAHLGIPFLTCDAEAAYKEEVATYFIDQYKRGLTPNPDVMCNQYVKFGKFLDFAITKGADFIATGHYVQKEMLENIPRLVRGVDTSKDQSYFLWSLTNEQLGKSLFPVGNSEKTVIRDEAESAKLPTATKKDSQGICFLGHVDIPEFLSHYVDLVPGNVINENGEIIGRHRGALVYTIGQRHGFTVAQADANRQPLFVINKNMDNNTVTVSETKPTLLESNILQLSDVVLRDEISVSDQLEAQFRYRQKPLLVEITNLNEDGLSLSILEDTDKPAVGQSCVLYRGSVCLGGGIIHKCQ